MYADSKSDLTWVHNKDCTFSFIGISARENKTGAQWLCDLDYQYKGGNTAQISHPDTSFWNQTSETLEKNYSKTVSCVSRYAHFTARKWQQARLRMPFWQWHWEDWFCRSFRQAENSEAASNSWLSSFQCWMYHQSWKLTRFTISVTFAVFRLSCFAIDYSHAI